MKKCSLFSLDFWFLITFELLYLFVIRLCNELAAVVLFWIQERKDKAGCWYDDDAFC